MKNRTLLVRASLVITIVIGLAIASSQLRADTGTCGAASISVPFTDVAGNQFFCQIAEAYFSGLTNGTTATTYSPHDAVPREQMAAFITRTQDSALRRGSKRAALRQWATPTSLPLGALTAVGQGAQGVESDGADLWVANSVSNTVSRVRGSDGKLLETWTGATGAQSVLVARGRVYVVSGGSPGHLYQLDPRQAAGSVSLLATVGAYPRGLTTDGQFIWVANAGGGTFSGSVSKVNPDTGTVQTFTAGFYEPYGILYDGSDIWVADVNSVLYKVNDNGSIAQAVAPGGNLGRPVFDGTNIWLPRSNPDSIVVVRASTGTIVAMLSGNGLDSPQEAAFDGQRILVTNNSGSSVSLWQATDFAELGSFSVGNNEFPLSACSDGVNFWITLIGNKLARF